MRKKTINEFFLNILVIKFFGEHDILLFLTEVL